MNQRGEPTGVAQIWKGTEWSRPSMRRILRRLHGHLRSGSRTAAETKKTMRRAKAKGSDDQTKRESAERAQAQGVRASANGDPGTKAAADPQSPKTCQKKQRPKGHRCTKESQKHVEHWTYPTSTSRKTDRESHLERTNCQSQKDEIANRCASSNLQRKKAKTWSREGS